MSLRKALAELQEHDDISERYAAASRIIRNEEQRRVLKVGDIAPVFAFGRGGLGPISSSELLQRGPIVATFYRGLWCPYCQHDLLELEKTIARLNRTKSAVIAIAHGLSEEVQTSSRFSFPIVDDVDGKAAERFGLRWPADEANLIETELSGNLVTLRGGGPWISPMQARFVIGRDNRIAFAEAAFTYEQRSEPSAVLPVLEDVEAAWRRGVPSAPNEKR